ncbi:MAG: ATP-binding cassette domain-containing protein [Sediminibacterium sp.]|uniref:peptidase domain-containing ABC transporter n=1 Tax=Sediminibacterium sp. TaxID=1917865 RepID=UPI002716D9AE|nr:ATP-binding cassette domain-containing protein [Sediminibacterium sp.]MDO8995790.1 ATP-binding cassette domain-containing protein [Sediminibacterium sp.]
MEKNKNVVSPMGAARKILELLSLDKKDVSSIYAFAILAGILSLAMPLGIQTIIGFVLAGSLSTSIVVLIVLVVAAVIIYGLLQVRQLQVTEKIQQKIFVRYSFEFADRLPKMNIEKLDAYYLPELVNRFFDTVSLQKAVEKLLLDVPAAIIQIFFGLILLSFYHPVFIAFGAVLALIGYLIMRFTLPAGFQASIEASDQKFATAAWLEEMARVIKSFKYSRGTELNIRKTDGIVSNYLEARTSYFKVLLTQYWSLIMFKVLITAAMLIVGAVLLVDQQINIGQFIAADIVILSIIASVEKLILNMDKVYDVLTSVEKLSKITESEIETQGSVHLSDTNRGVSVLFENVGFVYGNQSKALEGLQLDIAAGDKVCIMGESGSGKSTILRLLTGAFKNFSGSILVDGIPMGNYNLQSVRSQTGILLSQQDIFHGTIWENITMGSSQIQYDEVTDLVNRCGLTSFIQSLPKGYDTLLDPTGKRLNSKIRQDILLLRALLGKKRLLLLEEPLNFLEKRYKQNIQDYIFSEENATVIIATNDVEIAARCNKVIYLQDGFVKAAGNWSSIASLLNENYGQ